MSKYKASAPPTDEIGMWSTVVKDSPMSTYRADALRDYNIARAHDGFPPLKRMPRGTVYRKIG